MYHSPFWVDFGKCKMQLQDSQSKLPGILLQFFTHSYGSQGQVEFNRKYPPSVTVLHQILVPKTCPWSCKFIQHWDSSIFPVNHILCVPYRHQNKNLQSNILFICWSSALEQTSIWNQSLPLQTVFSKGLDTEPTNRDFQRLLPRQGFHYLHPLSFMHCALTSVCHALL